MMQTWVPAVVCGSVAVVALRRAANLIQAAAQAPSRLDMDPFLDGTIVAEAKQQQQQQQKGQPPQQQHQPSAAVRAWCIQRDVWLAQFNGRGRDPEYDRSLKQLYSLKPYVKEPELVDSSCRYLESLVVATQKLVDGLCAPTKNIHALMYAKYVKLSSELKAVLGSLEGVPIKRRQAESAVANIEALADRYYAVIASRCADAP